MRSPFELMLPLMSQPLRWLWDPGGDALTGRATGTVPPARRWARHSHGRTNVLRRVLAWCLIVTVWGNAVFYVAAAGLTTGRGLTFGANRFGGGDWFNSIGYMTAMVAVFAVIWRWL
jgi:hypothetical protein